MLNKTHRRTSDNNMAKTSRTNNVIQNTSKNVRQYHGQNQQGQTMLYKTHQTFFDVFCITLFVLDVLAMLLSDVLRCVLFNIVSPCRFWP
jgi:hypothetical protein